MSRGARPIARKQRSAPLGATVPIEGLAGQRRIRSWSVALLGLLTAAMWQLCFAPFNLGFLGYVVLVPWALAVVGAKRNRTAVFWGWIAGMAAFGVGLYWLTWVTLVGYAGLIVYLSVYWLVASWTVRRASLLRMPMWIVLPVVWVALEYARSLVISGFPWFFLAHSQYRYTPLIQITDITGEYGVSFFVAMVNGLVVDLLVLRLLNRRPQNEGPSRPLKQLVPGAAVVAATFVFLMGYGIFRLWQSEGTTSAGPRVGVVQCAFPNSLDGRDASEEKVFYDHLAQTQKLIGVPLDLIVWPETELPATFNLEWDLISADQYPNNPEGQRHMQQMQAMQREMADTLMRAKAPLLGGAVTYRQRDGAAKRDASEWVFCNSVLLLEPVPAAMPAGQPSSGPADAYTVRTLATYDKMHCVPFGEYVPFREGWPWLYRTLRWFVPKAMEQLEPGSTPRRFTIGSGERQWSLATPVCYEGLFARVCRSLVYSHGIKKADVLVNLSNDGWFIAQSGAWRHASTELDQHLSAYVFRAIENRVPVVRAVNCGISGFVDSSGRIQQVVEQPEVGLVKLAVDVGHREVLVDSRRSLYSLVGDLWAWACCAAAAILMAVILVRTRSFAKRADMADGPEK